MFVCRPRLPDPIRHNLCATCSFVRRLQTFLVSSALFARMQCTGCSARSRTRSGPAGRRPVGQQAGKFCRTFDIHRTCGVRLPRPFAFVASHIPDSYQARPDGSGLTTAWRPARVHRSTSDFVRSSQARPLARRPREVPFACQALLRPAPVRARTASLYQSTC